MTGKFHISSDGQARACRATKVACKLDSDHYDSKEEAQAAYEKLNEAKTAGGAVRKATELNTIPKVNRALKDIDRNIELNEATMKEVGTKALKRIADGQDLGGFKDDYRNLSEIKEKLLRDKKVLSAKKDKLEEEEKLDSYKKPALISSIREADSKLRELNKIIKNKKTALRSLDKKIIESARNNVADQDAVKKFDELEKELIEFSRYRTNISNRKNKLYKEERAAQDAIRASWGNSYNNYDGACGGGRGC